MSFYGIRQVSAEDELGHLPDGSVISWLRIPGDPTSRAVAFVNIEYRDIDGVNGGGGETVCITTEQIVWVSPGGWAPMVPAAAGLTYPLDVLWLGDMAHAPDGQTLTPPFSAAETMLSDTLISGGTWARERGLDAAVTLVAPHWTRDDDVETNLFPMATAIAEWLDPQPPLDDIYHGELTDEQLRAFGLPVVENGPAIDMSNVTLGSEHTLAEPPDDAPTCCCERRDDPCYQCAKYDRHDKCVFETAKRNV